MSEHIRPPASMQQDHNLNGRYHQNLIMDNIYQMMLLNELTDCTLVADGREIHAHKLILSTCSPVFKGVFERNREQFPILTFIDMTYEELSAVIVFMYKGQVNVRNNAVARRILKICSQLKILGLVTTDNDNPPNKSFSSPCATNSMYGYNLGFQNYTQQTGYCGINGAQNWYQTPVAPYGDILPETTPAGQFVEPTSNSLGVIPSESLPGKVENFWSQTVDSFGNILSEMPAGQLVPQKSETSHDFLDEIIKAVAHLEKGDASKAAKRKSDETYESQPRKKSGKFADTNQENQSDPSHALPSFEETYGSTFPDKSNNLMVPNREIEMDVDEIINVLQLMLENDQTLDYPTCCPNFPLNDIEPSNFSISSSSISLEPRSLSETTDISSSPPYLDLE